MPTTSAIATARDALVTALDAEATLTGNVHYAWEGVVMEKPEAVWIDQVSDWTSEIASIKAGRKHRNEQFTFQLVINVVTQGVAGSAQTCFERAVTLHAAVEDALADDVQAGTTAVQWLHVEGVEANLLPYEKGWLAQLVVDVTGHARLT